MPRMQFQHTPLINWPREATPASRRKSGLFKSKLPDTVKELAFELSKIGAINPILISTDHPSPTDISINGLPRMDVRPRLTAGVIVEFFAFRRGQDGERERMQFACDTYQKWTHNLHAILLTLKSLRAIDRYGATSAGEQYAGFKALPAPGATGMTVEAAAHVMASMPGVGATARMIVESKQCFMDTYRAAVRKVHPDAGGAPALWTQLQAAESVLRAHHNL